MKKFWWFLLFVLLLFINGNSDMTILRKKALQIIHNKWLWNIYYLLLLLFFAMAARSGYCFDVLEYSILLLSKMDLCIFPTLSRIIDFFFFCFKELFYFYLQLVIYVVWFFFRFIIIFCCFIDRLENFSITLRCCCYIYLVFFSLIDHLWT